MISKVEADAQAIMWMAFASDRHSALEITDYAERYVKDRLQSLARVAKYRHRFVLSGHLARRYHDRAAVTRLWFNRCFQTSSRSLSFSNSPYFSGYDLRRPKACLRVLASLVTALSH